MGVKSHYLTLSEVGVGSTRSELKHLSNCRNINQVRDSPSSGERNGNRLNQLTSVSLGLRDLNVGPVFIIERRGKAGQSG
jgi:hypothetical protein